MTTPQQPISSGFGHDSTAAEVLEGVELSGRLAIVTGGYSGLGLETTRALAGAGAHVIVPSRRSAVAEEALAQVQGSVEVEELDLSDLGRVRAFTARVLKSARPVGVLINNAGIMACPETRVGENWEAQFATNHLGHFVLTCELWPALTAAGGARVVSLSSTGHKLSDIRWQDPMWHDEPYEKWRAYGQSKTANSLFAVHLDSLGADDGVRAFAVHPGGIMTPLQRHMPREEMVALGWIDEHGAVREGFKTPEQGAATSLWAATSPMLDSMGGVYCEDCDIAAPTDPESPLARYMGVDAHAVDRDSARRLWEMSAEFTGADLPSRA